jgi:hypothetical protein
MGPIEWLKRQQQQRRAAAASAGLAAKKQSSRVWDRVRVLAADPNVDAVAVIVGILLCVLGYVWHLRTANIKSNKSNKSTPKQAGNGATTTTTTTPSPKIGTAKEVASPGPLAYVKSLIATPLSAAASSSSSSSSSSPQQQTTGVPSKPPKLGGSKPPPSVPLPKLSVDQLLTKLKGEGVAVKALRQTEPKAKDRLLRVNASGELSLTAPAGESFIKSLLAVGGKSKGNVFSVFSLKGVLEGDAALNAIFLEFGAPPSSSSSSSQSGDEKKAPVLQPPPPLHVGAHSPEEKKQLIDSFTTLMHQVKSNPKHVKDKLAASDEGKAADKKDQSDSGRFKHTVPFTPPKAPPSAPPTIVSPSPPSSNKLWTSAISIFSPTRPKPLMPKPQGDLKDLPLKTLKLLVEGNMLAEKTKGAVEKSEFVAVLAEYYSSFA